MSYDLSRLVHLGRTLELRDTTLCGHESNERTATARSRSGVWRVAALAIVIFSVAPRAQGATFRCPGGDVQCLIAAINEANTNGHSNTIRLAAGSYVLQGVDNNTDGPNGLPSISGRLRIQGAGSGTTSIARAPSAPLLRLIHVGPSGHLTVDSVTLTRGGGGGFIKGAGLYNGRGVVNLTNSVVSGNTTGAGQGGGLFNQGLMNLTQTTVSGNNGGLGGGLFSTGVVNIAWSVFANNISPSTGGLATGGPDSVVRISDSRFTENRGIDAGGVVVDRGGLVYVTRSTFDHGTGDTGAIFVGGFGAGAASGLQGGAPTVIVSKSTFSDNRGINGGAIGIGLGTTIVTNTTFDRNGSFASTPYGIASTNVGGTLLLINSTVADNQNTQGLSHALFTAMKATTILVNTILARNSENRDCAGPVISLGGNLIGDPTGCSISLQASDRFGDPSLGSFTDNATPGYGHVPLLATSQAINSGNNAFCPRTDQLGQRRIGPCDIGSIAVNARRDRRREMVDGPLSSQDGVAAADSDTPDLVAGLTGAITALKSSTNVNAEILKRLESAVALVVDGARNGGW